jgi:hypothetical protein
MIRIALLALVLVLAACAGTPAGTPRGSVAEGLRPGDAEVLAAAATDLIRQSAEPGDGPLGVRTNGDAEFTPVLLDHLRRAGFIVTGGERLRYQIGPIAEGMMVRVMLDGGDAARLYVRDRDGGLVPRGPVTVRRDGP